MCAQTCCFPVAGCHGPVSDKKKGVGTETLPERRSKKALKWIL